MPSHGEFDERLEVGARACANQLEATLHETSEVYGMKKTKPYTVKRAWIVASEETSSGHWLVRSGPDVVGIGCGLLSDRRCVVSTV